MLSRFVALPTDSICHVVFFERLCLAAQDAVVRVLGRIQFVHTSGIKVLADCVARARLYFAAQDAVVRVSECVFECVLDGRASATKAWQSIDLGAVLLRGCPHLCHQSFGNHGF